MKDISEDSTYRRRKRREVLRRARRIRVLAFLLTLGLAIFLGVMLILRLSSPDSSGPLSEENSETATSEPEASFSQESEEPEEEHDSASTAQSDGPDISLTPGQQYLRGYSLFSVGQLERAAHYFQQSAEGDHPLKDYAQFYLARTYFGAQKYQEALSAFQALAKNYPDSYWYPDAQLGIADSYLELGDLAKAEENYGSFVKTYPQSPYLTRVLLQLGDCLEAQQKWDEAAVQYQNLWLRYPLSSEAGEAQERLDTLLSEQGISPPPPSFEQLYERALIFAQADQSDNALSQLEEIYQEISQDPSRAGLSRKILLQMGILNHQLRRFDAAIDILGQLMQRWPDSLEAQEALLWRGRIYPKVGKREKGIQVLLSLASRYPGSPFAPRSLYEAAVLLEGDGKLEQAWQTYLTMVQNYATDPLAVDGLWKASWISYRSGDMEKALQLFEQLTSSFPRSSLVERALYWEARARENLGDQERALSIYSQLLNRGPLTYYGLRAAERVARITGGGDTGSGGPGEANEQEDSSGSRASDTVRSSGVEGRSKDNIPVFSEVGVRLQPGGQYFQEVSAPVFLADNPPSPQAVSHLEKGRELVELGLRSMAVNELELSQKLEPTNKNFLLELSDLYLQIEDYPHLIRIAEKSFREFLVRYETDSVFAWEMAYPLGYQPLVESYAGQYAIDPYLLFALIREESHFNPRAVSVAGARGLMQIMPSTGESIAANIGEHYSLESLQDPEKSIRMGSWYLKELLDKFDGNVVLALAGYNGGPGAAARWRDRFSGLEEDEFVESIPYRETRGYVKKVLRSYAVYQSIYGEK
ncbi:MAG: Soluble lytic murein transglycosylase [Actinobacteria bacterium]|nr:Soluble lytic murein transglycosylase [Actinomycetota bacterium]